MPERLVVNPGDGSDAVVYVGAPVAVTRVRIARDPTAAPIVTGLVGDGAEREDLSGASPSIVWHATWSASTGEGGTPATPSMTSLVRELAGADQIRDRGARRPADHRRLHRRRLLRESRAGRVGLGRGPRWRPPGAGGERPTTNQRMEIMAVLEALRTLAGVAGPGRYGGVGLDLRRQLLPRQLVRAVGGNGWRNARSSRSPTPTCGGR